MPRLVTDVDVRQHFQITAKESIGVLAADLVNDGSSLMMNGGTTMLSVVRHLGYRRELTIATNNLRIPVEISADCVRNLYLFGGPVRLVTQTTTGPIQFHSSAGGSEHPVRCDLALIAVGAVSTEDGYSTTNLEDAAMMRDMMERSDRVAVLADPRRSVFDSSLRLPSWAGRTTSSPMRRHRIWNLHFESSGVTLITPEGRS